MKRFGRCTALMTAFLLGIAFGCNEDPSNRPLPDAILTAEPASGSTTDVFALTVTPSAAAGPDGKFFYRWDWNGDGIWDTRFGASNSEKHRYYQAGHQVVKVEMIDGKKQTRSFTAEITVVQGYSPPRPEFSVTPETGNPSMTFTFDASATRDDEDSLNQLQFRWDPMGDGRWLIPYSSNPTATYQYSRTGDFKPQLQVKDPSGRTALVSHDLAVTLLDTLIRVTFTATPDSVEVNHETLLDATGSVFVPDTAQSLLYAWLVPGTPGWTDPAAEPRISSRFVQKGPVKVTLKAINPASGYYNTLSRTLQVVDENKPPTARFVVSSPYGNILTQFYLDAWTSSDDRLLPSDIEVRWDFEGDGTWDTPFSKEKNLFHVYPQPGTYQATLEVRDDQDQRSTTARRLIVSGNSNPTSYFMDQRDGRYYGTVQIGSQWWMSQNMNYAIPGKQISGHLNPWNCLLEKPLQCDLLGKMYFVTNVIEDAFDDEDLRICPTGWRLPTQSDWETLLTTIGGEQNGSELRLGGKWDFNALDMGYGSYQFVYDIHILLPVDTLYPFKETYRQSWFFSSTQAEDINHLRVDVWMLSIDRNTLSTWTGFRLPDIYVPARCIKE